MTTHMEVIECAAAGGPEVLRGARRPVPEPGPGEVRIRVAAAGLNHADLAQRHGIYPPPAGASDLLGLEVAGEIEQVGTNVTRWVPGDRVCALMAGGGYAEFALAHESLCLPVPQGFSLDEAAVLPEAFATVWVNVYMKAGLKAGERLLVHGGSSGVGMAAIQLAHALGSEVWATAGSEAKCQACREQGAICAINYKTADFEQVIKGNAQIRMDVVLDMIGGPYFEKNLHLLAPGGRIVYISALAGRQVTLDLVDLMRKRASIFGSVLRPLRLAEKAAIVADMALTVWPLLESGAFRPLIHQRFAFHEVAQAHTLMQAHGHIGKLVLVR